MTDNHPITPPPELLKQWLGEFFGCTVGGELSDSERYLATQAAQWGADQELEACCEWLDREGWSGESRQLHAARRPKPPSLKEQALTELNLTADSEGAELSRTQVELIRRALEQLDD